jgi:hypothetical protein
MNGPSLLDRLLGVAVTLCLIAVMLVLTVHLIESVLSGLLIGLAVLGGVGLAAWILRRKNRYW